MCVCVGVGVCVHVCVRVCMISYYCGLHMRSLYTVVITLSQLLLKHTHTAVHVILVTDMVVLLTERDQRYHLASLLDHKVESKTR